MSEVRSPGTSLPLQPLILPTLPLCIDNTALPASLHQKAFALDPTRGIDTYSVDCGVGQPVEASATVWPLAGLMVDGNDGTRTTRGSGVGREMA